MTRPSRIYWVNHDRFDTMPDKSTWVETAQVLANRGYEVEILTYGKTNYQPDGGSVRIRYFRAWDNPLVFRMTLMVNILTWLLHHSRRDDLIIVHPEGLFLTPIIGLFGRRNIHLDIRTVPVELNSIKKRVDRLLFWTLPMKALRRRARGYSFITGRLKDSVEKEFNTCFPNYVIWTSGVNSLRFGAEAASERQRSTPFILFYHGTISEKRGLGRVIEAMAEIQIKYRKAIRFVLFGDGPGTTALKKLSSELGVSDIVSFEGLHPYESIPSKIVRADMCICPLPDRAEWNVSSPIKVFEYMASGKPMILTPIPAHLDVAANLEFVVWTDGDRPQDFKRAIEYAYRHRQSLKEAASAAPGIAREHHDWEIQGRRLANYLDATFDLKTAVDHPEVCASR